MLFTLYLQGSVATQLRCGGIFNNALFEIVHESASKINLLNHLIFGEDMDNDKMGRVF